jgi:hypothetical protein
MDLRCIDVARTACAFHLCEPWQQWRQRHTACAVGTALKSVAFHAENKRADFTVPLPACAELYKPWRDTSRPKPSHPFVLFFRT